MVVTVVYYCKVYAAMYDITNKLAMVAMHITKVKYIA
jgi:hypothetical protein